MNTTASILLSLSLALLGGLLLSRLAKKVKLPAVTAYLIAGVLIGPFVLGSLNIEGLGITEEQLNGFGIICDLALGFIAFSMGNEFRINQLKKIGKQAMIIGIIWFKIVLDNSRNKEIREKTVFLAHINFTAFTTYYAVKEKHNNQVIYIHYCAFLLQHNKL